VDICGGLRLPLTEDNKPGPVESTIMQWAWWKCERLTFITASKETTQSSLCSTLLQTNAAEHDSHVFSATVAETIAPRTRHR